MDVQTIFFSDHKQIIIWHKYGTGPWHIGRKKNCGSATSDGLRSIDDWLGYLASHQNDYCHHISVWCMREREKLMLDQ